MHSTGVQRTREQKASWGGLLELESFDGAGQPREPVGHGHSHTQTTSGWTGPTSGIYLLLLSSKSPRATSI